MTNCTAFANGRRIASGSRSAIAPAVKAAYDGGASALLVFEDETGQLVEMDLRGSIADVVARLQEAPDHRPATRGRPKLGVIAREVTLLPVHWDWLAAQPGGASAVLRRLVEQARKASDEDLRKAQDAAYRVMLALAGDLPEFEEASRAFFAHDFLRFAQISDAWSVEVRDYIRSQVQRVQMHSSA